MRGGALPLDTINLVLSRHAEAVYNLGLITEIWPISLKASLPVVPIPLLPGDADVALDVQQVFTTTYDLLGYDLALDYTQPPEIPLPKEDVAWVETLLRTSGLR